MRTFRVIFVAAALGLGCEAPYGTKSDLELVEPSIGDGDRPPGSLSPHQGDTLDAGTTAPLGPSIPAADGGMTTDGGTDAGAIAPPSAQHQHANLVMRWSWSGPIIWNVDQTIQIDARAPCTFYAHQVGFAGTSHVAYVGLQTDGRRFDGTTGDTAIFTVWNATAATGAGCGNFAGEGTGYSCRVPMSIALGKPYTLRVWKLDAEPGGQWWGAWIIDASGLEIAIGQIRAPAAALAIGSSLSFAEYFGPDVGCDGVPTSSAVLGRPRGNFGGNTYAVTASYASASRGACTGGSATPSATGVEVAFGGPR